MTLENGSLLDSPHLSSRTHTLLSQRLKNEKKNPQFLTDVSLALLERLCEDILPQETILPKNKIINIAVIIDQSLQEIRDGWRFAELPSDQQAWEIGLQTIEAYALKHYDQSYCHLSEKKRGDLLDHIHAGKMISLPEPYFTADQMALWSGDLRSDILNHFLAHPTVQDELNISASLTGGDERLQGFKSLGFNAKDFFER